MSSFSAADTSILRSLAERVAGAAQQPQHAESADRWRRLNDLKPVRPLVWITEIPWHEMNVDDELTVQCVDTFCRTIETQLRQTLYQWDHMHTDRVMDAFYHSRQLVTDTGFGLQTDADIRRGTSGGVASRHYHPQIQEASDIEKIKTPRVTVDQAATDAQTQALESLLGDILPIQTCGIVHTWFSPWDALIQWWGVEEALMDLALKPELVHAAMERFTHAHLARLSQWEELGLLTVTEGNYRVGSGGPGYTTALPQPETPESGVKTSDQWGCATAQIFSEVSPDMHEEFALRYEKRWLERFGLTYYGCCEPLHNKIAILKSIPNLRKISVSPWADIQKTVEQTNGKYVLSYKPNPAILATDAWQPDRVRAELRDALRAMQGHPVEIVMKDISTVHNKPRRLWEWAEIAMDVAQTTE